MRIKELSRLTGISERMLRYYEQEGLLKPTRTSSGYRDYGDAEVQAAQRIRLLSDSGLKIDTIEILLPCMRDDNKFEPCQEIREAMQNEVAKLDQKLLELEESRRIITGYLKGIE